MSANAYGLIKMLDQRFETLIKVASEMMLQQEEYIRHGGGTLKPLTLRDIAEKCNIHESTVSRAVMGKTVMVPQGLFELKHFFYECCK